MQVLEQGKCKSQKFRTENQIQITDGKIGLTSTAKTDIFRTNDLEVDHIIPISKGGKSTYDNLQTLCHRCNVRKGAKIE